MALAALAIGPAPVAGQTLSRSDYDVIERRNIFRPAGAPTTTEIPAVDPASDSMKSVEGLALTGIVRIGSNTKAIVESSAGKGYYVGVGGRVGPYSVKEITETGIVLEKNGVKTRLYLNTRPSRAGEPLTALKPEARSRGTVEMPTEIEGGDRRRSMRIGR